MKIDITDRLKKFGESHQAVGYGDRNEQASLQLLHSFQRDNYIFSFCVGVNSSITAGTAINDIIYGHKGNLKASKGDDTEFGNALHSNPVLTVYANITSAYLDSIGKEGIEPLSFCINYAIACLPKYLRCLVSKKDYQAIKKSIKNLFNKEALDLSNINNDDIGYVMQNGYNVPVFINHNETVKHVAFCTETTKDREIKPGEHKPTATLFFGKRGIAAGIKDCGNKVVKGKTVKTFLGAFNACEGNLQIPIFSINVNKRMGKSRFSLVHLLELTSSLFRYIFWCIFPYADQNNKLNTLSEDDIREAVPLNAKLSDRRNLLFEILKNDFSRCCWTREEIDRDIYKAMLQGGIVFNRIFREYVNHHAKDLNTVPTIFLAKKFKRIR